MAACRAPVAAPTPPSGEVIAYGGGPGGSADACFACHGLKGEGDALAPRLAGLSQGYLLKQLEDYAGRWRDHPQMSPVAARLDASDRLAVARYYAALTHVGADEADTAVVDGVLFRDGDRLRGLPSCASCHGADGRGGGLATPALAGQRAAYVREQLLAWKNGKRRNDPRDVMGAVARRLSLHEIEALAAHVQALP